MRVNSSSSPPICPQIFKFFQYVNSVTLTLQLSFNYYYDEKDMLCEFKVGHQLENLFGNLFRVNQINIQLQLLGYCMYRPVAVAHWKGSTCHYKIAVAGQHFTVRPCKFFRQNQHVSNVLNVNLQQKIIYMSQCWYINGPLVIK